MIRQFVAAVSFLTRLPVASRVVFSAEDVGKSARWFPVVGGLLGVIYVLALHALSPLFPATVVAVLIVMIEALLTGALHIDGLADMADGFGGGHTREDVLRIMRDHAIGTYGAIALILLVLLKVISIAALSEQHRAEPYLVLAPMLGRWSTVMLNNLLPYARRSEQEGALASGSVCGFVGRTELFVATLTALVITGALVRRVGVACWLVVIGVSALTGRLCLRRIGGVTGDTLGANTEFCEVGVLLVALALH